MNFLEEYKLTEKYPVISAIDYITKKTNLPSGTYNDGIISILDVNACVAIMKSWEWKFNNSFIPIAITAFGDMFLYYVATHHIYYFQPQYDTNDMVTPSVDELFEEALLHPAIKSGLLQEEKFKEVSNRLGYPKYGDNYILKPWLLLGGTDTPENYVIGKTTTYFDLVSQTLKGSET